MSLQEAGLKATSCWSEESPRIRKSLGESSLGFCFPLMKLKHRNESSEVMKVGRHGGGVVKAVTSQQEDHRSDSQVASSPCASVGFLLIKRGY